MTNFISQTDAEARAASVEKGLRYSVYLHFLKGETYRGVVLASFSLKSLQNVFLDFNGTRLTSLVLNGQSFNVEETEAVHKDCRVTLPESRLKLGPNVVRIAFENKYSNDGNGLHSFTDTDGKQYLYTQTEPFSANRIFPLFDQPDLKGKFKLTAVCPDDWIVVSINPGVSHSLATWVTSVEVHPESAEAPSHHPDLGGHDHGHHHRDFHIVLRSHHLHPTPGEGETLFDFEETPLLSTYLYGFAVGPFRSIPIPLDQLASKVPMTIYVRDSLFKYAEKQAPKIYSYADKGILFYSKFYGCGYPFRKFDFVFCPEYTMGAMEYPGVITFNDRLVFREDPTPMQTSRLGEIVVHELAHMWFGNLVTMKWWNDLWLKESFAEFSAFLCNAHINHELAFRTTDSWVEFQSNKFWGYEEDQLETTHPIFCQVANTSKAESIFDGITYSKGAAVLKQLFFVLGEARFSANIASYFQKYQWSNTTLDDFMAEMGKELPGGAPSDFSIAQWRQSWIETAGLNTIQAIWDPKKQGPQELVLKQGAALPDHATLRTHKILVAFLDENAKVAETKEVVVSGAETKVAFENKGFRGVIPNFDDWAFIKLVLDEATQAFVVERFGDIDSKSTQLLIARSLQEAVRDVKLRGDAVVHMLLDKFFVEKQFDDGQLLRTMLGILSDIVWSYLPRTYMIQCRTRVFEKLSKLLPLQGAQDISKTIIKEMITFAFSEDNLTELAAMLDVELEEANSVIGVADKWRMLFKVNAARDISSEKKSDLTARMSKLDQSDGQKHSHLQIAALTAGLEERGKLWERYTKKEHQMSFGDMGQSMGGFFSIFVDEELKRPFWEKYFQELPAVLTTHSKSHADVFLDSACPGIEDEPSAIARLEAVEQALPEAQEFFKREIRKKIDGMKRQLKIFELFKVE